jgi:hypothetical protein
MKLRRREAKQARPPRSRRQRSARLGPTIRTEISTPWSKGRNIRRVFVALTEPLAKARDRNAARLDESSGRFGRRARLELPLAFLVALAFASSFGLNFGIGNQVSYLTPSLRLLDPTLLARDWFVTATTQYHPVFAELGAWLLAVDRRGWALAVTFVVVVTAGALTLFALLRALAGPRAALPAYLLTLAVAFVTRTQGPMLTYVFDGTLQPSTLSSALFLGAAVAFVLGRFGWSGVLLGASGVCHMNLLVLLVPAFCLAHVALGRERLVRRLVTALGPAALAVASFLPMLVHATAPVPNADFARHVYVAIRAPHHFDLAHHLASFVPFCAWQLLGGALVVPLVRNGALAPFTRLAALLAGMLTVIWTGMFGALASERFGPLFAWRLVPHAELLLQAAVSAIAVRGMLERELFDALGARARFVASAAFVTLLAFGATQKDVRPVFELSLAAALFGAYGFTRLRAVNPIWLTVALFVLLANFAAGPLARIPSHSSLLTPLKDARTELETWMRERSPKQALFLTPPEEETLRFWGERAIVVDWKGNPAIPSEILEWYRRIGDVVGRREVRSEADLAGYANLDGVRLEALRARYGFDFCVVRREHAGAFGDYARAYENADYVVLAGKSR